MANTPNNNLPYLPENVVDPAAATNLAVDAIDTLLQLAVIAIQDAPPVVDSSGPLDGDRYIVGTGTGDWAGHDGEVAKWVDDPGYWTFAQAKYALNLSDGLLYINAGSGWSAYTGSALPTNVAKVQDLQTSAFTVPAPDNPSRTVIVPTDSSAAAFALTPAASGWQDGDSFIVVDSPGTSWGTNAVSVAFQTNGHNYHEDPAFTDSLTGGGIKRYTYVNSTTGFANGI